MGEETSGGDLPEGCISHVLALTTPRDACRSSAISATFRSAAASDTVWERFLPSDCEKMLSRAVHPVGPFASKRELYLRLCEPLLVDDGKMSFSLEKASGKMCYMLSARELCIVWGDTPLYWRWIPLSDSRFSEVAELLDVCWLEIRGKIKTKDLSPKTSYAAYLVFKIVHGSYGFHNPPQETSVKVGVHVDKHTVRLQADEAAAQQSTRMFRRFMPRRGAVLFPPPPQEVRDIPGPATTPRVRSDGWMEIELGEFFNQCGDDGEVDMNLMEVKGGLWKRGLIIQGIEVRPKK